MSVFLLETSGKFQRILPELEQTNLPKMLWRCSWKASLSSLGTWGMYDVVATRVATNGKKWVKTHVLMAMELQHGIIT